MKTSTKKTTAAAATATKLAKQVQSATRITFSYKPWTVRTKDGVLKEMAYVYLNDVRMWTLIKSYVEGAITGFQYKGKAMPKAFFDKLAA